MKTRLSRIASAVALLIAHAMQSGVAKAEAHDDSIRDGATEPVSSEEEDTPWYVLSVRPSLGLGIGDLGGAERLGLAAEYWFNDTFGGGLVGAVMQTQTGGLIDFGPGTSSAAWVVAPVVALRGAPGPSYFIASLGAGYASVSRHTFGGLDLCLLSCAMGQNHRTEYGGYAVDASVGWLAHPGRNRVEIGPVFRFEMLGDFSGEEPVDSVVTLNLEFGLGLPGQ